MVYRLSGTVILYNKYILAYYGFPFPIALTMWHMTFSGVLAFLLVRLGFVGVSLWACCCTLCLATCCPADSGRLAWLQACDMSAETYLRAVVPIGACFAGTLWLGNAAYLYLSVAFIQMLKVGHLLAAAGGLPRRMPKPCDQGCKQANSCAVQLLPTLAPT